jgi:hypothetical protein
VRQLDPPERDLRQQRLHCLELNRGATLSASWTGTRTRFNGGRVAAVTHRTRVSTLKCTSESSSS